MKKTLLFTTLLATLVLSVATSSVSAQDVPPLDFIVDATGRVRIRVASTPEFYYVLYFQEDLPDGPEEAVSMALGEDGTTTLTEQLAAYPREHYRVARYEISEPGDVDGDGIDDVEEFSDFGRLSPFNPAAAIEFRDGTTAIADRETFEEMSYQGREVLIDTHLEDLEYLKFYFLDMHTDTPKLYFMNTETHRSHGSFARAIGIPRGGRGMSIPGQMRGEIVYHPSVLSPSGAFGVYRWEFEPNDNYAFADVQRAYELMATNLPLLKNDWAYYPMPSAALPRYRREQDLYDASRVKILLEEDIYADINYIPLNLAEGYGLLRVMGLDERPNPRDIVLYEAIPSELPRVGGIITAVPQTPLSHVNLRAIQDGVPNAYIAGAMDEAAITDLVGKYVYYRVAADEYEIRESTRAEVEAHYADRRPAAPYVPERDLSTTGIAPLDDIGFTDWQSFGVKAANMATLRTFGFPETTIRDGFAVPFYFYDEFMKHNGLYDDVRALLADPEFQEDFSVQDARLAELRDKIEDADMPGWMLDELAAMHAAFPAGQSIRCRSSTNNEDLPGFSGAGLYDSYTHKEDEGHISKSIKQVYASLWNFRAFAERDFYRIDHLETAMGVLAHQSFDDEQANGVGVTTDPVYGTENTFYLNSQVGEDLVTNPEALSIPEEILLGAAEGSGFVVVRPSNQVPDGTQVMSAVYLEEMRTYLGVIDAEFRTLYEVDPVTQFAMEIEYKITIDGDLAIKQARPWIFAEPLDPDPTPGPTTVAPTATPRPTDVPPTPTEVPSDGSIFLPILVNR